MQKVYEQLTVAFRKNSGILDEMGFENIVKKHTSLFEECDTIFMLLQASGYPIEYENGYIYKPFFTSYKEEKFCIIDIETNGSNPNNSQVIEIGAVMVQNDKIVDRFETFVECAFLPEYITKVTGIEPIDLLDAPSQKEALTNLRVFMQDAIFVAHNASFDYSFLNASFKRHGLGEIGNMKLCTIDLARRTFESERYGLAHLIEYLKIPTTVHHRAYSDALSASYVMKKSFETIPHHIKSSDDLLKFATSSKKERSKKEK
ncbi:MAG: 3'-5' exonuclease [Campylobacterales bacterium]|nr:3'-5' exonuclease [Campylobacterales bacterium]